jgi:hypothetical protein
MNLIMMYKQLASHTLYHYTVLEALGAMNTIKIIKT